MEFSFKFVEAPRQRNLHPPEHCSVTCPVSGQQLPRSAWIPVIKMQNTSTEAAAITNMAPQQSKAVAEDASQDSTPLMNFDHERYDAVYDGGLPKDAPPVPKRQSISSKTTVTYLELLRDNTNYRYYWLSYVANHMVCSLEFLLMRK